jgi:hypothetical protein
MSSSLILQRFSEYLNNPEVLTTPQEYLGLHYKKVLEFWLKIEKLTQEQWRDVNERCDAFHNDNYSKWDEAANLALDASEEGVGGRYAYYAGWAAVDVTKAEAARWATRELVGNVANPSFLKMFDNL